MAVDDLAGTQRKIRIDMGADGRVIEGVEVLGCAVLLAERDQDQEMAGRVVAELAQHRPRGLEILEHVGCGKNIERHRQRGGENVVVDKVFRPEFMPGFAERVVRPVDSPDAALRETGSEGVHGFALRTTPIADRQAVRANLVFQP